MQYNHSRVYQSMSTMYVEYIYILQNSTTKKGEIQIRVDTPKHEIYEFLSPNKFNHGHLSCIPQQ